MFLALGIDVGTTKTACVIRNIEKCECIYADSMNHEADLGNGIQNVTQHIKIVELLLNKIPQNLRDNLQSIGVTGQMHGVLCWNNQETTELFTWQSKVENLHEFQKIDSSLQHGYGITTLAQLAADKRNLKKYDNSGTIHDYVVWKLCGKKGKSVIDYTDAASWGAYDLTKNAFNFDTVKKLNIPPELLPQVVPVGTQAGVTGNFCGLKDGIKVMSAIGDNQSSVFAVFKKQTDALSLTIGTGIQLSLVTDRIIEGIEIRPYINNNFIAVAAPLCGGATWAWLKNFVKDFIEKFSGTTLSDNEIYQLTDKLALSEIDSDDLPEIAPNFLGERYNPDLRGVISNLDLNNFSISKIAAALALGLIRNLFNMMPDELWRDKKQLLVSGNAIRKNLSLRKACEKLLGLSPILQDNLEEAAQGAAELSSLMQEKA